ncbi:MAG: hypothetical protein HUU01_22385, partial [Saprospiraceae bacterium]|nr:hypothetical protein [Saprospiraceae bacterium]
ELTNRSFEDPPGSSVTPSGWYDCGFEGETPPDILPSPTLNIGKTAYHRSTYLGLTVRDNNTWESISQELRQPMQKGACYQLEVYLARAHSYWGISRITGKEANYKEPALLRIFGGFDGCDGRQLLAETPTVSHTDWRRYVLQLEPALKPYDHLILEAHYGDGPMPGPNNGNVLVDSLSNLIPVDCNANPGLNKNPEPEFAKRQMLSPKEADRDLPLPVSEAAKGEPISETQLLELITTTAPRIAFDPAGNLEHSHYTDPLTNKGKWANLLLKNILDGLAQHPLAILVIVIPEKDPNLAALKKQNLKEALVDLGALQEQVILRDWLEKDVEKVWYGNAESGVLMRLIR